MGVSTSVAQAQNVVILGAGTMGRQIALLMAVKGHSVVVIEKNSGVLAKALEIFVSWIAADIPDALATDGKGENLRSLALGRIRCLCGTADEPGEILSSLAAANIVIETLPEDLALKEKTFSVLGIRCGPQTILATGSSSYPVSRMSRTVLDRNRVCNLHFFMLYPLRLSAAEVGRCEETSDETVEYVSQLLNSLSIVPFVVQGENVGFIFNFIWHLIKAGMLYLVDRGVTDPQTADRIYRLVLGANHGPFFLMQLVGMQTVSLIEGIYRDEGGPGAFPENEFLRQALETGLKFYPDPSVLTRPGWLETGTVCDGSALPFLTRESLSGVWNLCSMDKIELLPDGKENNHGAVMGRGASGQITYTKAGDLMVFLQAGELPLAASSDPLAVSDTEAAQAFRAGISYSGSYQIEGRQLKHTIRFSSFPRFINTTQIRDWQIDSQGRLILQTPAGHFGGAQVVIRLVWKLDHKI